MRTRWPERGKQPLTPRAAHGHGSASQANYERDTLVRVSTVSPLFLYYSSIIPLLFLYYSSIVPLLFLYCSSIVPLRLNMHIILGDLPELASLGNINAARTTTVASTTNNSNNENALALCLMEVALITSTQYPFLRRRPS